LEAAGHRSRRRHSEVPRVYTCNLCDAPPGRGAARSIQHGSDVLTGRLNLAHGSRARTSPRCSAPGTVSNVTHEAVSAGICIVTASYMHCVTMRGDIPQLRRVSSWLGVIGPASGSKFRAPV